MIVLVVVLSLDTLFDDVLLVFRYIHQNVFLSGFSESEFNPKSNSEGYSDSHILTLFVGRHIAKEACAMILEHYLSTVVPSDVEGLNNFGLIASKTTKFENELVSMGIFLCQCKACVFSTFLLSNLTVVPFCSLANL